MEKCEIFVESVNIDFKNQPGQGFLESIDSIKDHDP
jgi:hypothetical protein